jgi:hypothetical protein
MNSTPVSSSVAALMSLLWAVSAQAKPVDFAFSWGVGEAEVVEKIDKMVNGTPRQLERVYTLRLYKDDTGLHLTRSTPVIRKMDQQAIDPTDPIQTLQAEPFPQVILNKDGTVQSVDQVEPYYQYWRQRLPAHETARVHDAEQMQQWVFNHVSAYWCQWSCPWVGLSLEANTPRQTPQGVQYIHARDVMGETVTYSGLYQKGPLLSVTYQSEQPVSGRNILDIMPHITQALGDTHALSERDLAALPVLSGSRVLTITAALQPASFRPAHVKVVRTVQMSDLKTQPHVATDTHDFRFRWMP